MACGMFWKGTVAADAAALKRDAMKKISWLDRLRYAFDNTLANGPLALVGWLALASTLLVVLTSVIVRAIAGHDMRFLVIFWDVLFQALTPNPVAFDAGPAPFLLAMLLVTLGSLFMVSILIGVLTTGIEDRVHSLRKGRSRVLENGHTVILGWDNHIFTILSELTIANQNQPKARACIAILADKDKVAMEDEIRQSLGLTKHTRLVCRSGDPLHPPDLEIVSLNTARSIIILPPDDDDPDASVIKILLAIVNNPRRRSAPYHIVAEIHNPANLEAAKLVGGAEAELVLVSRLTAHIIAQTCRRSGLSTVYTELLNFEGDEIYFKEEPTLVGQTYAEVLLAYETSAIIGLRPKTGRLQLNPPMDTRLQPGDQLIAISADDDTVQLSARRDLAIDPHAIHLEANPAGPAERTLMLGWNERAPEILREMDYYVAPGSQTTVAAEESAACAPALAQLQATLQRQRLTCVPCNTTNWQALDELHVEAYQRVVVLAYSDMLPPQKADARTLVTLLHLRDIARRAPQAFTIVSEMLDEHNRDLAQVTQADDFIVSGKLASLLLAQISENKELHEVFRDLFSVQGSEIYMKLAADYVSLGVPVNFYTVVEAARQRGETALGYRIKAQANDAAHNYGVVTNPNKFQPVTFAERDRIIVLAECE
jgi:ion channel POLLUX/CASTOR